MTDTADATDEHLALHAAMRAKSEYDQLEGAFEEVRRKMLEAIAGSKVGERDIRETLYLSINALEQVRVTLLAQAAGVEMAEYVARFDAAMRDDGARELDS